KKLNVSSFDVALHLYKLKSNGYLVDQIQSAKIFFSLTEKGFLVASQQSSKYEEEAKTKEPIQATLNIKTSEEKEEDIEEEINYLISEQKQLKPEEKEQKKEDQKPIKKKLPWEVEEKKVKLDKTKMFISKMEYYIQQYGLMILLTSFLLVLIIIALFVIFLK
ncbi:MAG: hypothetical protein ACK4J0_04015, partial [Candidatus Anstonellaceae archaeon]